MGGNFREMLGTIVRINFCGSNFRSTCTAPVLVPRARYVTDDVVRKLVPVV